MPQLLRKVGEKLFWDWEYAELRWLPAGEFPAFPLVDLVSDVDGEMSVWLIDDASSNLNWILAALAANRNHVDKLDYILFDRELAEKAGLELQQTPGKTKDLEANEGWHFSILRLTASRAITLAQLIHGTGTAARRVAPDDVEELVRQAVAAGRFKSKSLGPAWQKLF